uniref:Protein ECT2 n=1 Tax=Syphacia muris TaxID=451379 RepID=A0A0N5AKV9_9BILA
MAGDANVDDVGDITASEIFDTTRANHRTSFRKRVNRVCLIGEAGKDPQIISLLKDHFHVRIFESETGDEYKNETDILFVCPDFDDHPFKYLNSLKKPVIGPPVIRYRASVGKPLTMPRPNRALYNESMADVCVVFSGIQNQKCRYAVDLIHHMGGSARKGFPPSATHLITEVASGENYRMAISMGTKTVHQEWLNAAWAARNDISVSVTAHEFIKPYLVEPFCGLFIWFAGFSEEEEADMRAKVVEHKGYNAKSQGSATHVVLSNSLVEFFGESERKIQHFVTAEWFWISIQLNCCANEDLYQWKGIRSMNKKRLPMSPATKDSVQNSRRSLSRSSMEILESSTSSALPDYSEHLFSSNDKLSSSPRKIDKRHAVCKEMLETEDNYLKALRLIVQLFKEPLEEHLGNPETELLSKAEIVQIFSRVHPLIAVHEKIFDELRKYVMHWSPDRLIGKVWLDSAHDLHRVYNPFLNSYDTAVQTLDYCDKTKPKFHAFLKAIESRSECQRNQLNDLLVRPVQRLPSVVLLLKAVLKKTERSNPDAPYLTKAMKALENVLASANESRRQTESYTVIFRISREIDRCPAEMLSSNRTFMSELHVISLGGEEEWEKTRGKPMTIFLFNDLIEIVKVRSGAEENNSSTVTTPVGTLSRQFSFASLRREKKKYKHYQQHMLTSIKWIDSIIHKDISGVFVMSFRMYGTDSYWVAQCQEDQPGETRTFLNVLTNQIFYLCGRVVNVNDLDVNDDSLMCDKGYEFSRNGLESKDYKRSVLKALHHAARSGGVPQVSIRPQNQLFPGLRRAASQMHLGITNTLSRFQSRAHLAAVAEIPNSPKNRATVSVTPHRTLRQMISASTFLPTRMNRTDSIRSNGVVSSVPME